MALPSVHHVVRVRVHYLILRLDYPYRSFLIRALLTIGVFLLGFLGRSLRVCFGLCFLSSFFFVRLDLTIDVFLQLCLRFVHVHIVNQLVVRLGSHSH